MFMVSVSVSVRARFDTNPSTNTYLLPALTSLTNYLLCHEILEIVFVLGWCLRARANIYTCKHTNTTTRVRKDQVG